MNYKTPKLLFVLISMSAFAFAGVIYVDNNITDGYWQDAYPSLQQALTASQSGDEIWVAQGTYTPGVARDASFVLKAGVKLYGGFFGGEVSLNDRDLHSNKTILSGEIGDPGSLTDNSAHILYYSGPLDSGTLIDGFVIRDAYADDGSGGGGLLLENGASPMIRNCHFIHNYTDDIGAAANVQNAPVFEHCLFENNQAARGGAVASEENRIQDGSVLFDHCTFVKNVASTGSALYFEKRETALIDSCVFWQNTDGSANVNSVFLDTRVSTPTIESSAFDDASVSASIINNVIYYTSTDADGPFLNTDDYRLDNDHAIPREWGWYYVQSPLVLNIRLFLEGAF
jgi:predicted outer membrane repeat protein